MRRFCRVPMMSPSHGRSRRAAVVSSCDGNSPSDRRCITDTHRLRTHEILALTQSAASRGEPGMTYAILRTRGRMDVGRIADSLHEQGTHEARRLDHQHIATGLLQYQRRGARRRILNTWACAGAHDDEV